MKQNAAFPKPKDAMRPVAHIRIYPSGRQVLNRMVAEGKREYKRRIEEMRVRQGGRCCLEAYAPMCRGSLAEEEATFEHENGRGHGGAKRDDRIVLRNGNWLNGASHLVCNNWKGSRYIDYNRGFQ